MEQLIDYFACFGGIGAANVDIDVDIDPFLTLEENIINIYIDRFENISDSIYPDFMLESPYREILISISRGDGKILNIFKRAKVSEVTGGAILNEIMRFNVLELEESREEPILSGVDGRKWVKKELRRYRIQPKVRFLYPFHRFWFGFLEPYRKDIQRGFHRRFLENLNLHKDMAVSLIFEQLSNTLLEKIFSPSDPVVSKGGLWDRRGEFDLLCYTKSGKVVVGECKFRGKKVCKSELNKLKEKAKNSDIKVDTFALFSKSGFSNELRECRESKDGDLMLFDLMEFKKLLT